MFINTCFNIFTHLVCGLFSGQFSPTLGWDTRHSSLFRSLPEPGCPVLRGQLECSPPERKLKKNKTHTHLANLLPWQLYIHIQIYRSETETINRPCCIVKCDAARKKIWEPPRFSWAGYFYLFNHFFKKKAKYLNRRWFLPTHLKDAHQEFSFETVIFEFVPLSGRHVLRGERKNNSQENQCGSALEQEQLRADDEVELTEVRTLLSLGGSLRLFFQSSPNLMPPASWAVLPATRGAFIAFPWVVGADRTEPGLVCPLSCPFCLFRPITTGPTFSVRAVAIFFFSQ